MNHSQKYNIYRQTFPEMVYESFCYNVQPDGLHISFCFHLRSKEGNADIVFYPKALFEARDFLHMQQSEEVLDLLVFNIGMIELISYWKCACPPHVHVKCGKLDDQQVAFWKKLYFNGEGEFFWVNGIHTTPDAFMTITSEGLVRQRINCSANLCATDYLVPIGGGKDSVVTLEALKKQHQTNARPLIMNPRGATRMCAERGGYDISQVLVINRSIDPLLLDLNAKGMLNGHTPFSAMLAFYTLLAEQLSGLSNVALSNESSANEGTVAGTNVNHQYSKSLEFENDFRAYVRDYICEEYRYFSFLRPLSELQIAMLFARQPQYFEVFKSCNVGSKQDIWCGHCAKCLFAFIILSPFLPPSELEHIFGKNMLDDAAMQLEFDQLTGHAETKPFECVGTISEVNSALSMALSKYYLPGIQKGERQQLPALLQNYQPQQPVASLHAMFTDHNLTAEELAILKEALK